MERKLVKLDRIYEDLETKITVNCQKEGLTVTLSGDMALIGCSRLVEYYRGLGILSQWQAEGKKSGYCMEKAAFEHLTYMVDCSRNAVCSISYLKKLLVRMALMGYDRLMLYTEDTYEIEGRPFFGWMRGRFTKEEIRELDAYAAELGIELAPCIQTLAHLNAIFRWRAFEQVHDTGDILNCGEEKTYELIEDMIRTWSENVRSRVINIGMDEAEMIGRGRFLNENGYLERFEIMQKHLKKVLAICEKYGFTCMMWSDMFFKLISGGGYHSENIQITEEIREKIPQNVELLYWDYYSRNPDVYDRMFTSHKKLTDRVGFAGGAWKWNGFAPLMRHSMQISALAMEACCEHGIGNVLVTGWGDDGGEAAQNSVLPVLALYAESCYAGRTDEEWVAARLKACTGAELADFMELDIPNLTPDNPSPGRVSVGPAKYLLYQDPMLGIYDMHVDPDTYPEHFAKCEEKLSAIAEKGGEFAYLFATLAALSHALEYKCDLGIRLYNAYQAQDREELKSLTDRVRETADRVEEFRKCFMKQWMAENRPFGWEVQDIRIGGIRQRLLTAADRVEAYLEGRVTCLEELEEERMKLDERENPPYKTLPLYDNSWKGMVTAGVI